MDLHEESSKLKTLAPANSRTLSSVSSAFYSASQSPFFSPRSPKSQHSEPSCSDTTLDNANSGVGPSNSIEGINQRPLASNIQELRLSKDLRVVEYVPSSTGISNRSSSSYQQGLGIDFSRLRERNKKLGRNYGVPFTPGAASLTSSRIKNCAVYIGLHGRKPSLLRFANWFRAELEILGISCFASDRARIRHSRKHRIVERAMDASSFGVVILTRKSFKNPYTIEELRFFSSKRNLAPVFFDLGPGDCLVRDIVEKRGEFWEKHGGELWTLYGGLEKEWKEAVYGLSRIDEWKLEAQDGNWRECILNAVTLLAIRLGRRNVVERISRWRKKAEEEEFPFPRNENFIGRKKELSELELILSGTVTGDLENDYFNLKARLRRKNLTLAWSRCSSFDDRRREMGNRKGKEPLIWKEFEKEIEMQSIEFPQMQPHEPRGKNIGKHGRRRRSVKIIYGKGIACVSGESGIGKTELLLEFAYRFHQRYKMVLWIGGESRYLRQNYLNLWTFLEVDVGIENSTEKSRIKSFEEQEEAAIFRVRRELMRNVPYLVIIDNLESEKDWWDQRLVMDLLPRFGSQTHFIISTRLPRVMNLEPLKLSYLSGAEAMSLMKGTVTNYPLQEIDALRVIEEKLGRVTLGLAIVGAILSELPINPIRLLDTINRMASGHFSWSGKEGHKLSRNAFLLQLFEVCLSIFDHPDGPKSLATRMVLTSGWFAPAAVPVSLLASAADKIPDKSRRARFGKRVFRCFPCRFSSYGKRSEAEAVSMLLRFNIARGSIKPGYVHFNEIIKLYSRNRGGPGAACAMVQALIRRGPAPHESEHLWAGCFLVLGFGSDAGLVELRASELLVLVKQVVLPLAIRTFITFSRCTAAVELLRLCADALEAADQVATTPVKRWFGKAIWWRPARTTAQLNPRLWQDLALARAAVLETRAKLMMKGGQFDVGDDLIKKAIFIRTSISGENHPDTVSSKETLSKFTRLLANVEAHNSP
ncbi:hypothetical protein Nepgr_030711 [Nepenthes gracilis]|uniref:AAA+ ATPase domain-containing protein n=1 Tax=Nepenthes gracilis TaxID=150966 RepID=A0AAD3TH27_NEPGR|nr:hypothetical protein Nepgr_030711 [Nepenthes gracilis]